MSGRLKPLHILGTSFSFLLLSYALISLLLVLASLVKACYPRRAWAATGIVVRWFVCLCILSLLT